MSTTTRFEKETKGNSEMAFSLPEYLSWLIFPSFQRQENDNQYAWPQSVQKGPAPYLHLRRGRGT